MKLADSVIRNLDSVASSVEFCWKTNDAAREWRAMRKRWQRKDNMADRDTKNPSPTPPPEE